MNVTYVIPSIPPRVAMRDRAVRSCLAQDRPTGIAKGEPLEVLVEVDEYHEGAWTTRNRGLEKVTTEWTAFLDDDDELLPCHTAFLLDRALEHHADVVWGWFEVVGGTDPFPHHQGKQWNPAEPHIFPITVLARTDLLHAALGKMGGFQGDKRGDWMSQDFPLWQAVADLGGRFMAFPDVTWRWHHHQANTSGLPERW